MLRLAAAATAATLLLACQLDPQSVPSAEIPASDAGTPTDAHFPDPECSDYTPCTPASATATGAQIQLGTGEECFVPISDGATLGIFGGPQGGFHIWVAVRCAGLGDAVKMSMRILDPDGASIALVDPIGRTVILCDGGNGWEERSRLFGYLNAFLPPEAEAFVGRDATVRVTLTNDDGEAAEASADVTLGEVTWWH